MKFQIKSPPTKVQVIAKGSGIRERKRLVKAYGRGAWRKMKGIAIIQITDGEVFKAELHWYEAHGIGKKEFKIKRIFSEEEA